MSEPGSLERVRNCVAEGLNRPLEKIGADDSLFNDLDAESIDVLDIAFRLEKEFDLILDERKVFSLNEVTPSQFTIRELARRMDEVIQNQ